MHIAVNEGYEHTVKSLVEKGANVNIPDNKGVSIANLAIMHDQGKLVLLHGLCDLSLSFIFTIHVGNLNLQFYCFKRKP